MIYFENWNLSEDGEVLAYQYDHLSRALVVTGDIPDGWDWVMLVRVGEAADLIALQPVEDGLCAQLNAQQLSLDGYYEMQLRGTQGEQVKHTNVIFVYIPASLSGDESWPEVPSAFTELERRVTAKAKEAEQYAAHPPCIGENGNWMTWEETGYADTGKPSRGERGDTPQKGVDYFTQEEKKSFTADVLRNVNSLYSNALKGKNSGTMIRLDDVAPLESQMSVSVKSKNLFSHGDCLLIRGADGGFTAVRTDNGYLLTGAHTTDCFVLVPVGSLAQLSGKTITKSVEIEGNGMMYYAVCAQDGSNSQVQYEWGDTVTLPQAESYPAGYWLALCLCGDTAADPVAVVEYNSIQVEEGVKATAFTPYVMDLTRVALIKTGLNLWDEQWELGTILNSGVNVDASDTIRSKNYIPVKAGVSLHCLLPQMARAVFYDGDKKTLSYSYPKTGSKVVPAQDGYMKIAIGGAVGSQAAISQYEGNICISVYDEATNDIYAPYQGTCCVPEPDGTVNGVVACGEIVTLLSNTPGVRIECEYNRDINKALEQLVQAVISMGGNV